MACSSISSNHILTENSWKISEFPLGKLSVPIFEAAPQPSTGSRTTRSAHFLRTVKSPLGVQPEPPLLHHVSSPSQPFEPLVIYSLRQLHPNRSLDVSFQSFVMGLRFSSGLDESYGFPYGNIGVHFLSLFSVRVLSWIIVKSISPPLPPRLVTPFPSEICCYSTASFTRSSHLTADTAYGLPDICFWPGLSYLWVCEGLLRKSTHSWPTKCFPLSDVIKLRHRSSSEASCRGLSLWFLAMFLESLTCSCRLSVLIFDKVPLRTRDELIEAKESVSSPVFVFANHFKTLSIGPLFVGSYPDFSMFFGTSVSGSQVKHLYAYLHPFNTSITRIVVIVFVYRLTVEFTSGCSCLTLLNI
ncbi:hypothetical protein HID58_071453 [Brassica napus]|uniref:Uncharacterized protein n=1 Tax=Brassica napus TaxID=3708 RepID=A0ABQ7Z1M8_BRANA|nr:hypothetical protein HID58_071453 [Brassica napus]